MLQKVALNFRELIRIFSEKHPIFKFQNRSVENLKQIN